MPGSISQNELSRFRYYLWVVVILVAGLMIFGWGCSREADLGESQGEKPGIKAERVTGNQKVEPARNADPFLAGPEVADQQSEAESGGSLWVDGDLVEAAGIEEADALKQQIDFLLRENFRLKEQLDGMKGSSERDRTQTDSYPSGESEFLVEELLGKQEEIDSLQLEKDQLEEELNEIVEIATLLQEEVAELESERQGLSEEDLLLLQDEISRLRRENGKLEDRIQELRATIEQLQDRLSGMASEGIAVIAPAEATLEIAEQIRMRLGREEIPPKQAESVLVVVYSGLDNPLSYSYNLYGELVQDADDQMDIKASMFHAYIYQINDDLSVHQIEHTTGYY